MPDKLTPETKVFIENYINDAEKKTEEKKKKGGFWGNILGFLTMAGKAYWEYEKTKKK